jgi:hypothetical protein
MLAAATQVLHLLEPNIHHRSRFAPLTATYVRCIVQFFKQASVQSRGQTYTTVKRLEQAAQTSGENKGLGDAVNAGLQKMSVYYAVPITTSIWPRRRCLRLPQTDLQSAELKASYIE